MPHLFLSYSRWTKPFAERLKIDLERAGATVWLDLNDISPGLHWAEEIRKAVESATHALVLGCPQATASEEVRNELELIHQLSRPWVPLLLAGTEADLPEKVRAVQHIDFRREYWAPLAAVLRRLELPVKMVRTPDQLLAGNVTQAEAFQELHGSNEWVCGNQRFLGVPLRPSAYAAGQLIQREGAPFHIADEMQIMLKFSGQYQRADSVTEVLDFLLRSGIEPCLLYITGPRNHHTGEFILPVERREVWTDAVRLCHDLITRHARGRQPRIFLEAPQTLIFPIADRLREMIPYRLYQMNYRGTGLDRYTEVWNSRCD